MMLRGQPGMTSTCLAQQCEICSNLMRQHTACGYRCVLLVSLALLRKLESLTEG